MIFVHASPKNLLSRDSIYMVDVIIWPKFSKSNISIGEVIKS